MMNKKIVMIGPYSAIGGVSMHIKRLSDLLRNNFDFSFIDESPIVKGYNPVFNLRTGNLLKYFSIVQKSDIVHINSSIWWLRGFHIIVAFLLRKKIIVTFHALLELKNSQWLVLIKKYCALADKIIVVSDEMAELLNTNNVVVKEAFIPPNLDSESKIPDELQGIISDNSFKKIIISNAFRLDLHDNEDLYGLDLMVEVAKQIKNENKPYKIIFVVASDDDKYSLLKKSKNLIETDNLSEQITIFNKPISFVKLIEKSDLVVRATNTDGDALTIREALFMGKPVLASDVVKRPDGTHLFESRNSDDLFIKIDFCLSTETEYEQVKPNQSIYKDFYLSLYSNL